MGLPFVHATELSAIGNFILVSGIIIEPFEPSLKTCTHAHTYTHTHTHTDHPQLLCSGSRDNSVCLWDTDTGKSVSTVRAPRNLVTELEWIGGEMAVLQSSEDKMLRVWDLRACSMSQQFRARNYMQVGGGW